MGDVGGLFTGGHIVSSSDEEPSTTLVGQHGSYEAVYGPVVKDGHLNRANITSAVLVYMLVVNGVF